MMTNKLSGRRVENGRLAYYHAAADDVFWEALWANTLSPAFFVPFLAGQFFWFEIPFTQYLSKDGKILEAGCGTGQWVAALRSRGYNCIGLDFAWHTLLHVRQNLQEMPLLAGDILRLPFPKSAFSAIISLGVVEHRQTGPEPFLAEMWRVLEPNGRLLISVPYLNSLRLWR